jgi:hypothetical protein
MILGQRAASGAVLAIDDGVHVQQVSYAKLAVQLTADKQALTNGSPSAGGIIVDNNDTANVTVTGTWTSSTSIAGFWGSNYLTDNNDLKGSKSFRFTPNLPAAGDYDVYLRWTSNPNRPVNVPVDLASSAGTETFTVNQQANGGVWHLLGRRPFAAGTAGNLLIRTTGTEGFFVIADAARWVAPGTPTTTVQITASDAVAREGTADTARFTLVRASDDVTAALPVTYQVSGTAQNGSDITTLNGSATFAAGATTVTIPVQAITDSLAEGAETVIVTVQPGAGYNVGAVNVATVRVVDRPIDDWRHTHFTAAELLDPNISGNAADPDGDSFSNLEEYVMAHHPRARDQELVEKAWVNNRLTLTYHRRKAATDTTVVVEGAFDLGAWAANKVEEIDRVDEGDTEKITVRLIDSPVANRGFLRARIIPAP